MENSQSPDLFADYKRISFEAFGVRIGINAREANVLEHLTRKLPDFLPTGFKMLDPWEADHNFYFVLRDDGTYELHLWRKDFEKIVFAESHGDGLVLFENQLHLTIANHTESRIFVHAGVVGFKDKAIVIPATGFSGKTVLVTELVKKGALYYSDEYAVFDEDGLVHPFPRLPAVRGIVGELEQTPVSIESLGGTCGVEPLPVGMVLFTGYKRGAKWKPEKLSIGHGVMAMVANTIPVRRRPGDSMKVLNRIAETALMVKGDRGEAVDFAPMLLDFFERERSTLGG